MPFTIQNLRLKTPTFDLIRGLMKPPAYEIPTTEAGTSAVKGAIDQGILWDEDLLPFVKMDRPLAFDVVEWMQDAHSVNIAMASVAEGFERVGGKFLFGSADPASPGLRVGDWRFDCADGRAVLRRGYAPIYFEGKEIGRAPAEGKTIIATSKQLAIAAGQKLSRTGCQYKGTLLAITQAAQIPLSQRIQFPSIQKLAGPLLFKPRSVPPVPVYQLTVNMTSDKATNVLLRPRAAGDWTKVLEEKKFSISAGQSEFSYLVTGFPIAPSIALEILPDDGAKVVVDSIDMIPPAL